MKKQLSGLLITTREVEVIMNFFCDFFTKFEFQQLSSTLRRICVDDT
jgi:hypothetical protein